MAIQTSFFVVVVVFVVVVFVVVVLFCFVFVLFCFVLFCFFYAGCELQLQNKLPTLERGW